MSNTTKFKRVWDEVCTGRTFFELLEVVHPAVALEARMELVITNTDTSFLASFRHRRLAKEVLLDRLLIKVSIGQGNISSSV